MPEEKHIFDLSRCPHPMSEEFVLMDDDLYYECDKYEEYTERATAIPSGEKINSEIPCRSINDEGKYCQGTVQLQRLDIPKEIHWKCQQCGEHGAIINFEDSYWDISELPEEKKEQYLNQTFDDFSDFDEFDDLWADNTMPAELDSILKEMDDEKNQGAFNLIFNNLDPQFFEETMGLSADAFTQLFSGNWKEPGDPLHVSDDISYDEVRKSLFFYNSRSFLQLMAEQGSFKATKAGNLKRKTIDELIKTCRWPEDYLDKIHKYNKVINEHDIWQLHMIRVLMDIAGLIQIKKGAFLPVKKRLHLKEKEHAGELFQLLFYTYFVKMNMGYRSGGGVEYLQDGLPYTLYRLHQHADQWTSSESIYELTILPGVKQELEIGSRMSDYNPGISTMVYSLLKPLADFGVLEERHTGEKSLYSLDSFSEFRKTPLFDKVITFNLQ